MRRRQHQHLRSAGFNFNWRRLWRQLSRNRFNLLLLLLVIALAPPLFFHFRLTHFHQMQLKNCGWLANPPLVCAHGGDSINAFPNTMAAYHSAIRARVDCIEIDVSRSADGFLFALHDRDLQRISGNHSAKVGHWSKKDINELDASLHFPGVLDDQKVPTIEDALVLVSNTVRVVILDAKVGPPLFEKDLAEDILAAVAGMSRIQPSIVEVLVDTGIIIDLGYVENARVHKSSCSNCIVWAKSDHLVREITRVSPETTVGYIIMKDPVTGSRSNVLRMKRAKVVGVYHPLIDEKLVQILHGRSKKIYAWTVDDMVSMRDMLSNKVDAVVTSNPALLQQLMDDTRVRCLEEGFSIPR